MLARRLHTFLRTSAANGRTVVSVPPFTAYLDPRDPLRFLNYAIPEGDVEPAPTEVDRLRRVFHAHDRLPRLEWIEEVAPCVAPALEVAGMTEELRAPLMACEPDELVDAAAAVDELTIDVVGDADLLDCANLQRIAFGQDPLPDDQEPRQFGGGAVLARAAGTPVAAAAWTSVVDGVSEIVGVATAETWRRRGLAGAVTGAATRAAFAAGASLCILSPGDDTAQRVYERAGFHRVATMLNWSDPS